MLAAFRDGKLRTLIATDIAARGIDVDGVSHVFNYDLPNIPESYVHRIGRTARAGAEGIAISFCDHEERAFLRDIERLIRMAIPATDRRTGGRPAPAPHEAEARQGAPGGRPHRGGHQQRGNGGGHGHGGGHGRPGHNGKRSHHAGNGEPPGPSPERPARSPPPGSHGGGAKRHRKCYIYAALGGAALQRAALTSLETIGWRKKNCWSSTVR